MGKRRLLPSTEKGLQAICVHFYGIMFKDGKNWKCKGINFSGHFEVHFRIYIKIAETN